MFESFNSLCHLAFECRGSNNCRKMENHIHAAREKWPEEKYAI